MLKKQISLIAATDLETIQIDPLILVIETVVLMLKKKPELEMVKNSKMIERTESQDTIKIMMTENY